MSTVAAYSTAVAQLRTWAGHNPKQSTTSGPGFWAYPPPHDLIDFNNAQILSGEVRTLATQSRGCTCSDTREIRLSTTRKSAARLPP